MSEKNTSNNQIGQAETFHSPEIDQQNIIPHATSKTQKAVVQALHSDAQTPGPSTSAHIRVIKSANAKENLMIKLASKTLEIQNAILKTSSFEEVLDIIHGPYIREMLEVESINFSIQFLPAIETVIHNLSIAQMVQEMYSAQAREQIKMSFYQAQNQTTQNSSQKQDIQSIVFHGKEIAKAIYIYDYLPTDSKEATSLVTQSIQKILQTVYQQFGNIFRTYELESQLYHHPITQLPNEAALLQNIGEWMNNFPSFSLSNIEIKTPKDFGKLQSLGKNFQEFLSNTFTQSPQSEFILGTLKANSFYLMVPGYSDIQNDTLVHSFLSQYPELIYEVKSDFSKDANFQEKYKNSPEKMYQEIL